jgi:hypothetical protein
LTLKRLENHHFQGAGKKIASRIFSSLDQSKPPPEPLRLGLEQSSINEK